MHRLSDPMTSVSDLLQFMVYRSLLPAFMDPISLYTTVTFTLAFCHMEFCTQGSRLHNKLCNFHSQISISRVTGVQSSVCHRYAYSFTITGALSDIPLTSRTCIYMRQPGNPNTALRFFTSISHFTYSPWMPKSKPYSGGILQVGKIWQ